MSVIELILIGISLSMDAFAVSICKGLSVGKIKPKHMITAGLWFGGFQALMPLIGYLLGSTFEQYITSIDHWVAFILLGIIGFNMIKESREDESEAAVKVRLETYNKITKPLIDYYTMKGTIINVNGDQPMEDVFKDIEKSLEGK